MPTRPPRPCRHPGCRELSESGICAEHEQQRHSATSAKRRDRFYGSKAWLRSRVIYLTKHPLCERCGQPATLVHHREAIKDGGSKTSTKNLEALCTTCHGSHHGYGG